MGLLTLLEAGGMDFFKGAAFKPPPRRSEEEGVVYIRLVQASDTLLQANSAASLSLARLRSRFPAIYYFLLIERCLRPSHQNSYTCSSMRNKGWCSKGRWTKIPRGEAKESNSDDWARHGEELIDLRRGIIKGTCHLGLVL